MKQLEIHRSTIWRRFESIDRWLLALIWFIDSEESESDNQQAAGKSHEDSIPSLPVR